MVDGLLKYLFATPTKPTRDIYWNFHRRSLQLTMLQINHLLSIYLSTYSSGFVNIYNLLSRCLELGKFSLYAHDTLWTCSYIEVIYKIVFTISLFKRFLHYPLQNFLYFPFLHTSTHFVFTKQTYDFHQVPERHTIGFGNKTIPVIPSFN